MRILIVEDDQLHSGFMARALLRDEVHIVTTGIEAIASARTLHPDLILMDLALPEMSGTEAARELRSDQRTRHIPMVAITASNVSGEDYSEVEGIFDRYIEKPFHTHELREIVEGFRA